MFLSHFLPHRIQQWIDQSTHITLLYLNAFVAHIHEPAEMLKQDNSLHFFRPINTCACVAQFIIWYVQGFTKK